MKSFFDEYTYPRQYIRLFICLAILIGIGFYSSFNVQAEFNITDVNSTNTPQIENYTIPESIINLTKQEQNPNLYHGNFGIRLDNTCLTYLKNNLTSNCPSYEDILLLFPDTSVQEITGKFGYFNGIYQRMPTIIKDSFEYYRFFNHTVLFVDPPPYTSDRIKIIEIKANLGQYKLYSQTGYDVENHTLTVGVGRYIEHCREAFIDSKDWIFLLGDTIKHLEQNCTPESTTFNNRFVTKLNQTYQDITTSWKWKLAQYQKEALLKCGHKLCLNEKDLPKQPQ